MSFDKDVILLLLFICCSYDVIFIALDAKSQIRLDRERTKNYVEIFEDYKLNLSNFFDQKK